MADLLLSHFSNRPVASVRSVATQPEPSYYGKPLGFWVSVDGEQDWPSWAQAAGYPGLGKLRHRVTLAPAARILRCSSAADLDVFTERYQAEMPANPTRRSVVDWRKVASEYQGIIIAPYIWRRRMHEAYSWYYPWDCASGCIWDAAAVGSVHLISPEQGFATAQEGAPQGEMT